MPRDWLRVQNFKPTFLLAPFSFLVQICSSRLLRKPRVHWERGCYAGELKKGKRVHFFLKKIPKIDRNFALKHRSIRYRY